MRIFTDRQPSLPVACGDTNRCPGRRVALRIAMRYQWGFTLIELIVTVMVVAVLTTIAVPSFRRLTLSNRLTTSANSVVDALNVARMAAVKRNTSVQFCSNSSTANGSDTLGTLCGTDGGAVYAVIGGTTDPKPVQVSNMGLEGGIKLNGDLKAIRFTGQGLGYDPASPGAPAAEYVADICTTALASDNHRMVRIITGSIIRVETTTSATCQ